MTRDARGRIRGRYCAVKSAVPFGTYQASLVEAIYKREREEITIRFHTDRGEILRHSPISAGNGKHGDLVRSMFPTEFIPNEVILRGDECESLLNSKRGASFLISYARKDSYLNSGIVSVVPLNIEQQEKAGEALRG